MIIVLDCNIWISLTINSQIDIIADLADNGFVIASCTALRNEISTVLKRPKFAGFISNDVVDQVINLHDIVTTTYKISKTFRVTEDLKDDYLFALCGKCKADYFVTGDKLLLNIIKYKNTPVISLARFKTLMKTLNK